LATADRAPPPSSRLLMSPARLFRATTRPAAQPKGRTIQLLRRCRGCRLRTLSLCHRHTPSSPRPASAMRPLASHSLPPLLSPLPSPLWPLPPRRHAATDAAHGTATSRCITHRHRTTSRQQCDLSRHCRRCCRYRHRHRHRCQGATQRRKQPTGVACGTRGSRHQPSLPSPLFCPVPLCSSSLRFAMFPKPHHSVCKSSPIHPNLVAASCYPPSFTPTPSSTMHLYQTCSTTRSGQVYNILNDPLVSLHTQRLPSPSITAPCEASTRVRRGPAQSVRSHISNG